MLLERLATEYRDEFLCWSVVLSCYGLFATALALMV
jgi:hypothetical protein